MNNDFVEWLDNFHKQNNDENDDNSENQKTHRLDLFRTILPAIDNKDKKFYGKLSKEEQDSIEPWILMRWLTSAESDRDQPHYLLTVNDFVNNNFSALAPKKNQGLEGHKELQWMLLTLCGSSKNIRRKFLKPAKGTVKNRLEEELSNLFPLMKHDELELLLKINSKNDLEKFFRDNGYDDKTIKDLLKSDVKG